MVASDSFKRVHKDQSYEDIRKMLDIFRQNRAEIIRFIQESADKLDDVHKSVKISKIVTGSTGIVGTLTCATGLALAIPTGGLSMFLGVGGGVLAAASSTAHLGSDIFERLFTKSYLDKLDKLCQADEANILKLSDHLKNANEIMQENFMDENTLRETVSSAVGELFSLGNLTCSVIRVSQAATLTVNSVKFIGVTSAVLGKDRDFIVIIRTDVHFLGIATLPVQIIDLAANGHALHKNQASDTSVRLRQLATELIAQAGNIEKYIENLQLFSFSG
jgi:hypothetical protein